MARTTDTKRKIAASSGAALAAVMLATPGLAAPAPAPVQQAEPSPSPESSRTILDLGPQKQAGKATALDIIKLRAEYKHKGEYSVAGVGDGQIVFEDERGKLFYVDSVTGDQKFVTRKAISKVEIHLRSGSSIKWSGKVTIVGVDAAGHVIMTSPQREKFYLDPVTGDMIFVQ